LPQDPVSDQRSDPLGTAVDDLDARLAALEKTGQWWPGMISWTAAATAPQGWLVADGSTFDGDRYAALAAVLGGTTLPDLRNRFPIGAGDTFAVLATGGVSDVTLTGAQSGIAAHAHTMPAATGGPSTANTGNDSADHTHSANYATGAGGTGTGQLIPPHNNTSSGGVWTSTGRSTVHTHSMQSHTHTLPDTDAIAAANAASSHSVLNPYVGLTPLIHI
jgi:microcystin-dependent protein